MTLEEFTKLISECSKSAHIFVANNIGGAERVRSVSIRIDDDGVLSILCHTHRMKLRRESRRFHSNEQNNRTWQPWPTEMLPVLGLGYSQNSMRKTSRQSITLKVVSLKTGTKLLWISSGGLPRNEMF